METRDYCRSTRRTGVYVTYTLLAVRSHFAPLTFVLQETKQQQKRPKRKLGASFFEIVFLLLLLPVWQLLPCWGCLRRHQASSRRSSSVDPLTPTRSTTPRARNPLAHQVGEAVTLKKKGITYTSMQLLFC